MESSGYKRLKIEFEEVFQDIHAPSYTPFWRGQRQSGLGPDSIATLSPGEDNV
ncbi:MAG: hypothetical protein ISQ14_12015 [Verrucomicrobiae bacterium]|nr:hypothetical protein [Verrucomicrobiae bacterium]